ncbi:ricin B-like lectin [Gloeophyllum trabeum ATCC 11539]|uniref:Ricin B-like lectin n=1 Tax=Gloeophyllum trabeum (strain ATCC 11539 / FP-39264 / Madison 617) TaxID=670483 RepID=S7PZZ2_GLOTA|nr:ricin B-like lectin [Gloeophyllum trabeum ATCC 11539]EPQ52998.1 ricin B-like lectin [Gloeophyllum trabeum ATCC 11539]
MASIQSGQTYKIVNVMGGTCMDLSGGDNKSIIGFDYHDGGNQKWIVEQQQGGQWTFKSAGSGLYIGIEQQPGDGVPLVVAPSPFHWDVWPDEQDPSTFRVFVPNTSQNWDLSDHGNSAPGTKVTLWGKWEGKNQTWRFEQA